MILCPSHFLGILDAKIGAFLRRVNQFSKTNDLSIDQFQLSLDGRFSNKSEQVQLSPTETKILSALLERQGQIVSKDELLENYGKMKNLSTRIRSMST